LAPYDARYINPLEAYPSLKTDADCYFTANGILDVFARLHVTSICSGGHCDGVRFH